ncbi:MAG: gliding motility protein GldL [Sphingomonadales bacterium]|nr:gliding motility protein GldL [Sphingomonadales bacterium]
MRDSSFLESKRGKVLLNYAYGWGAAVVIIGALFKIRHLDGADLMLTIGLGTEAVIFFISGFEKPSVDTDWSLVYPELSDGEANSKPARATDFDGMMRESGINKGTLERLGEGFKSLTENVGKMSDISQATVATNEYTKQVREVAGSMAGFSRNMTEANRLVEEMNQVVGMGTDLKMYQDQIALLNKNLGALNAVYGNMLSAMSAPRQ